MASTSSICLAKSQTVQDAASDLALTCEPMSTLFFSCCACSAVTHIMSDLDNLRMDVDVAQCGSLLPPADSNNRLLGSKR